MNQGTHPTPLPREPGGDSKETSWFRKLLRCVRERGVKVGPGLRASYTTEHTLIELERERGSSKAEAGVVQRFYLDGAENEWLNCRKCAEDGTPIGDAGVDFYRIAKPPGLRLPASLQAVEDAGFTIYYINSNRREIRSDSDADLLIVETLRVPYTQGDTEIYGTMPVGKTGLTINLTPGGEQQTPYQLEWIECVSVRQWAPAYRSIKSCAAGDLAAANWQRLVHASERVNINAP